MVMISRIFFRFRACLIILLFLSLNISVPTEQISEESDIQQTVIAENDATAVNSLQEFEQEVDCLLEIIIEESLALYDLFPDGDWSAHDTTVPAIAEYDIISHYISIPRLYPPKAKRLLATDMTMPESNYPDIPSLPPEMNL